jgi:integrase
MVFNLENIFEKIANEGKARQTIMSYYYSFKKIVEAIGIDLNSPKQLLDVEAIKNYIYTIETPTIRKTLLNGYLNIVRHIDGYNGEVGDAFYKLNGNIIRDAKAYRQKNTATEREILRQFPYQKITQMFKKYKTIEYQNPEYMILALLSYLPPLRIQDYIKASFVENDSNYVDLDNRMWTIFEYKSSKSNDIRSFRIPLQLYKILLQRSKHSNTLFSNMDRFKFYRVIHNLLGVSVQMLRKIYISENIDKWSIKKREMMSDIMGHTVSTQMNTYTRFNKTLHPELKTDGKEHLELIEVGIAPRYDMVICCCCEIPFQRVSYYKHRRSKVHKKYFEDLLEN